jgi:glycosyltransferase involved in cell wall biosynthesis
MSTDVYTDPCANDAGLLELATSVRDDETAPTWHGKLTQHSPRVPEAKKPANLGSTRVSVVIPTLNEAANLPHVMPMIPSWVHEVLIVDGHSTDNTIDIAQGLLPSVRIILQDGRGKGNALACGFGAARGDIIVMLDADGSTDPQEIPQFVQPLLDGADFAKGSRCMEGGGSTDISVLRAAGNRALTATVNLLYGQDYSDLCYGYNAFWTHCLEHMQIDCDGFEVETLIHVRIARAGLSVQEVPSMEYERLNGTSNLRTFRDGRRVLRTILTERLARTPDVGIINWNPPVFEELAIQWAMA